MRPVFKPLNPGAGIHRRRRNLPHWEQEGCTYFVTFRTADALPQPKLEELRELEIFWRQHHPEPWNDDDREDYHNRFTEQIQTWLDAGHGACVLRQPELGGPVADALRHFDGDRYVLDDFVVMPNHIHVLVMPREAHPLVQILHTWKSFTAKVINARLGTTGTFWMDENFDHAVRRWTQLEQYRQYIRENPTKAGLRAGAYILGQGTAPIIEC